MFDEEEFLARLDKYEIRNDTPCDHHELDAIVHDCEHEDLPLDLATYFGFVLGCMKTKEYLKSQIITDQSCA